MEHELIARLREKLRTDPKRVLLGIGDDAAILARETTETVLTVDLLTEGVDFLLAETDPVLIGRKALAVNLSDLAAMSAVPSAAVIAVALPNRAVATTSGFLGPLELAEKLLEGILPLAERYELAIAGGDTNCWDGGLVVSITLLGRTTEWSPLRRNGAKVGDRILVTGALGGSILQRQFLFEPRVRESLYLNEHFEIRAAIDISDGLSLDLSRLAKESGLGARLWEAAIPVAPDARRLEEWERDGLRKPLHEKACSAFEHALRDGEDFELLLTASPKVADELQKTQPLLSRFDTPLTVIGEMTESPGLSLLGRDRTVRPLEPQGFVHH